MMSAELLVECQSVISGNSLTTSRTCPRLETDTRAYFTGVTTLAWTFISLQIKEFWIMGLSINDSVYSCLFFFLTGLHFFHLLVGLLLSCLFFWSCSFSFVNSWIFCLQIHFFKGATIFSSSKFLGFMTQEPIFYLLFHKDWYGILLGLQLDLDKHLCLFQTHILFLFWNSVKRATNGGKVSSSLSSCGS